MKERFRGIIQIPRRLFGIVGIAALIASGCADTKTVVNADTSPSNQQQRFVEVTNAVEIEPGEMKFVPNVDPQYASLYRKLQKTEQIGGDLDDVNIRNILSRKPYRYKTDFSEDETDPDPDAVCEDVAIPKGKNIRLVYAVKNSTRPAWVAVDSELKTAHICYDATYNPATVVLWGAAESRS